MTDPTPTLTRADVEALVEKLRRISPSLDMLQCEDVLQAADALLTLRERAEAAEAECLRLKNIRSAIAEGYNAEAVALEKSVSETLTAQLTVARRAEAAAWEAGRDAAKKVAGTFCWNRCVEGGKLKSPAVFTTHTWQRIQEAIDAECPVPNALRRAPTEGEA